MKKFKNVFKTALEYGEFFDKIPADKWCAYEYENCLGQRCVMGHLTEGKGDYLDFPFGDYLDLHPHPFRYFFGKAGELDSASINNGGSPSLIQLGDTPKERIINALILKDAGIWEEATV